MIAFQPTDLLRILPEIILCGFGILVMVLDPFVPPGRRSLLGWLALVGVLAAAGGTLRTSIVPAWPSAVHRCRPFQFLLLLPFLAGRGAGVAGFHQLPRARRYSTRRVLRIDPVGHAGMCFMASSTDLIMVFIGLEISSISTYILAGFKRKDALSNEASLKYFLLGSLRQPSSFTDCLCLRIDGTINLLS